MGVPSNSQYNTSLNVLGGNFERSHFEANIWSTKKSQRVPISNKDPINPKNNLGQYNFNPTRSMLTIYTNLNTHGLDQPFYKLNHRLKTYNQACFDT